MSSSPWLVQRFQAFGLLIFSGLSMGYARALNPRRLEYYFYAPWVSFCDAIIGDLKAEGVIVAPQYPLYVSSTTNATLDLDASSLTKADGKARSVLVDIACVVPTLQERLDALKGGLTSLLSDLGSLSMLFPSPLGIARISEMLVPLLLEIKRCVPRNPMKPHDFIHQLRLYLNNARTQVEQQAHCLFCMCRYATQVSIILIAAVGEYWCWRRALRNQFKVIFDHGLYFENLEDVAEEEEKQELVFEPHTIPDEVLDDMLFSPQDVLAKHKEEQAQQRAERQAQSAQRAEVRSKAQEKTPDIIQLANNVLQQPFDDEFLQNISLATPGTALFEVLENPPALPARGVATEFTGIMRLGSETSQVHMKYLQKELQLVMRRIRR